MRKRRKPIYKYEAGEVINGFTLIEPVPDKVGGWTTICKACGEKFIGRPKSLSDQKSCGCLQLLRQSVWLKLIGYTEILRLNQEENLSTGKIAKLVTERLLYHPEWDGSTVNKNMVLGAISRRQPKLPGGRYSNYLMRKPAPLPTRDFPDPHNCAYPLGHPGAADFHFCHEPLARFGMPYCAAHMKITYMPLPTRVRL